MTQLKATTCTFTLQIELEATLDMLITSLRSHSIDEADIKTIVEIYKKNENRALIKYGKFFALIGAWSEETFSAPVNLQPPTSLISPLELKQRLLGEGKTLRDLANEIGFEYKKVYAVVNGITKARWGESHKIAVALGLKVEA